MLRFVPLFRGLSDRAIERLVPLVQLRRHRADQMVFRKGDAGDSLYIVVTGRILVSSLSTEGAEVILNIINPTEVVGEIALLDGGPRTADATAASDTSTLVLLRRDFLPLLEAEPSAALSMLLVLCGRIRQTTSFVEDAVLLSLPARLFHRIQALARAYGRVDERTSQLRIEHGLSQQELGDSIGASRVSVNKQLNAWRAQSLLEFGRGFLVVRDLSRLETAVRRS
jgi:CRP-like cAMP-binding protein